MLRRLLPVAVALCCLAPLFAQETFRRVTEQEVRAAVTAATSSAKPGSNVFALITSELQKSVPTFRSEVVFIAINRQFAIGAMGPAYLFQTNAAEDFRRMEPMDGTWPVGVSISVSPSQISSPDFIRVVVTRDGKPVEPVHNALKPTPMRSGAGAEVTLHSGTVVFPTAAFDPGATVVVTAIPQAGTNVTKTFTDEELMKLQ